MCLFYCVMVGLSSLKLYYKLYFRSLNRIYKLKPIEIHSIHFKTPTFHILADIYNQKTCNTAFHFIQLLYVCLGALQQHFCSVVALTLVIINPFIVC